jgi:hypothetical protein
MDFKQNEKNFQQKEKTLSKKITYTFSKNLAMRTHCLLATVLFAVASPQIKFWTGRRIESVLSPFTAVSDIPARCRCHLLYP